MLGRLILLAFQLGAGWAFGPMIMTKLPDLGALNIFAYGAVFAVIVWLVGMLGAFVLKDVAQPSAGTLAVALVGGLVGAGLTLSPDILKAVDGVIKSGVPRLAYPLIGAALGYLIKR